MSPGNQPTLLHHFFHDAVRRFPDHAAVDVPPSADRPQRRVVSYAELARQADGIAGALAPHVQPDSIVAILLPRRTERLYSAQIGILQAGAAYASIDPQFPDGRIHEILDDSAAVALLTDPAGAERARRIAFPGPILLVDQFPDAPVPAPFSPAPENLAYVIYTSGTTGRPKGVQIEHRGIVNLIAADLAELGLTPADRVTQNSSAMYDSSVEEIWMAFSAGATLVVADEDAARLGPDLVPWLQRERITVFCPTPTMLRSIGCQHPEIDLPDLALIYTGGEAVPQDLADRWSKHRRLLNGYGPTECSVVATRVDLRPGEPVSIGTTVPGIGAWVLDDSLGPVEDGQWGELCLGGVGLARGYRNRPEQTAEKFVAHPQLGRIYRTGDLVHRDPDGRFFFHGRIDTQVKIRGFRIELEEIEMRLAERPGIRQAACAVQDGALSAFLVPENGFTERGFDALAAALRESLPEYMIPGRFAILRELPLTAGGKLNRLALPHLSGPVRAHAGTPPRTPAELRLAAVFRQVLDLPDGVAADADFFTDLGGNSLRAAQLVTTLREADPMTAVTVRDVYEARTVAALAHRLNPRESVPTGAAPSHAALPSTAFATIVQTVFLLAAFSLAALAGYWGVFDLAPSLLRHIGLVPSLLLSPVFFYAGTTLYTPFAVALAALLKRLLIGRYRPTRAPVWGSFYVRNWMVSQAAGMIPWWWLESTGFQNMALGALGAKIGRRVHIHRGVNLTHGGWDLLEIGDDVTISQEANLGLVDLEEGHILIRPVRLGDGATVDIRAGVDGDAVMEAGAQLAPLAWLPPGARIPAGERWDGIPAQPAGRAAVAPAVAPGLPPLLHDVLLLASRACCQSLPALLPVLCAAGAALALGMDADGIARWLDDPHVPAAILIAGLALLAASVPATLALEALLARSLGRVREGVISRWGLAYLRVRMKSELLASAGGILAGTLFWPVWLRAAGARIGRGCEISSILDTVPEMLEMGAGTFFADGIYVGGPRVDRGAVTLRLTRVGSGVFLGNHVVIPAGHRVPDGALLGVCTVAGEDLEAGQSWFGHPPFELPRREVIACDERMTTRPTRIRFLTRVVWELFRFGLPIPPALAGLAWLRAVSAAQAAGGALRISAVVCLAGLAAEIALCLLVLAVKWSLLGRIRPAQHPFWACWCMRWDTLYMVWENWAHPALVNLEGTLLLNVFLRAIGVRIGKGVILGPGLSQVVDPDMLILEDGATVSAVFQAHTFEDRVLKMDIVRVRRGATLGFATVPLYGAEIGEGAYVAPHSVIMKDEHLPARGRYAGAPTAAYQELAKAAPMIRA